MSELVLHDLHQSLGASFTAANDHEAVAHYGDASGEYAALTDAVAVLDLSFRGRFCLTGADRQRFLNGQVTNNVKDLQPGQGCYAAIVNHKGKMQGDLLIHALAAELLLDCEPGMAVTLAPRLEKFVVADDVQIVNVEPHYGLLSVQGPKAAETVAACGLGITLPTTAFHSVVVNDPALGELCVANVPRLGTTAFDLFVPVAALGPMLEKLLVAAAKNGGRACGWQALETARIEAGIPRFPVDMDETNLPPEAGLDRSAISYSKGCYTGQEVIARIRTYGQVAKTLRRLRLEKLPESPVKGMKLYAGEKEAGYLTSAIFSPANQAPMALGYVRREHHKPGTKLTLPAPAGPQTVEVIN
jgi:folate-binding protein YgfZ